MTSSKYDCEQLRELLPGYSLGVTDETETDLVEAELRNCPEAVSELADYQLLMTAMALNVPQVEPPAYLADSILAAVKPRQLTKAKPQAPFVPAWRQWLAPAAAVAAVLLLVLTNVYWMRQVDSLNQQQQQITGMLARQNEVLASFTQDETRRLELVAEDNQTAGLARVMWSPQRRLAVLIAADLPALSMDRTYQVWLIRGQETISCGLFQVDTDGNGLMIFDWPQADQPFESMGITPEPLGGSAAPTSPPVVVGRL